MCTLETDCYVIDKDTGFIESSKCGTPDCICGGTAGCISNNCSSDSDCQAKIGPDSVCNGGVCSGSGCTSSADCPENMQCNGNVCTSIKCSNRDVCAQGSVCSGQGNTKFCVRPTVLPLWEVLLFIVLTIVVAIMAYYALKHTR